MRSVAYVCQLQSEHWTAIGGEIASMDVHLTGCAGQSARHIFTNNFFVQVVHKFEHPGNNDNMLMKWEMVIIASRAIL